MRSNARVFPHTTYNQFILNGIYTIPVSRGRVLTLSHCHKKTYNSFSMGLEIMGLCMGIGP